ncbi:hypothetical protein [Streptomyces sp. NPDC056361]|uniref:hypothetical protein n=1 Tax=Streptomyces sp. NPDC056361 TaxID=3345795 RepID=UPI0035D68CE2
MEQLLADVKAVSMGPFDGSPVHSMNRWWRQTEQGWAALDEAAKATIPPLSSAR